MKENENIKMTILLCSLDCWFRVNPLEEGEMHDSIPTVNSLNNNPISDFPIDGQIIHPDKQSQASDKTRLGTGLV